MIKKYLPYLKKLFVIGLIVYPVLFAIGYHFAGLHIIGWHSHVAFYIYVGIFFYYLFQFIIKNKEKRKPYQKTTLITIGTLFLIEIYIWLFSPNITMSEKYFYFAFHEPKRASYYHVWNDDHWLIKPEFQYFRKINSLGFSDPEWKIEKKDNFKRVICIGDSFTEGDGAHVDSSYVAFLRRKIQENNDSADVLNAGVCGSDPFFYYINLKDRLLKYKPDVVVMTVSEHDFINDLAIRGGMERFKEDKTLQFRKTTPLEPLYAMSYISRIFFRMAGYNSFLLKEDAQRDSVDLKNMMALYDTMNQMAKENHFKFVLAFIPPQHYFLDGKKDFNIQPLLNKAAHLSEFMFIDFRKTYADYFKTNGTQYSDYFWKQDGHHNAKGYQMMAECIYPEVKKLLTEQ